MNKQELIKKYEMKGEQLKEFPVVAIGDVLKNLRELDEPGKVTIPQYVAGWIKYCKLTGVNLYHALEMGDLYFYNYANQKDYSKLKEFLEAENNQATFARAWLDGYEVEKEKRYIVKVKAITSCNKFLSFSSLVESWFFCNFCPSDNIKQKHTRKELEEADFGWVFDCPGIEIEEVERERR